VIGTDSDGKPFFGPARAANYDPAQWAMTYNPSTAVAEILQDPDPAIRARDIKKGEPVHMKPMPNKESLPNLFAILANIPLAREALLFRDYVLQDYGRDRQWWSGTSIELPQIIVVDTDQAGVDGEQMTVVEEQTIVEVNENGEQAEIDNEQQDLQKESTGVSEKLDVIHETQRLIAFLHASTRSYGSVEPLTKLKGLQDPKSESASLKTQADRFLWAWSNAAYAVGEDSDSDTSYSDLFLTIATNETNGEINFRLLELLLATPGQAETTRTLYDALDDLVWNESNDGTGQDYCLERVAPVLVLHVRNLKADDAGLGMSVPPILYLDRYLQENKEIAKSMQSSIALCRAQLKDLEERKQKLQSTKHLNIGPSIDTKELFKSASAFLKPTPGSDDGEEGTDMDPEHVSLCAKLAAKLDNIYLHLEEKMKGMYILPRTVLPWRLDINASPPESCLDPTSCLLKMAIKIKLRANIFESSILGCVAVTRSDSLKFKTKRSQPCRISQFQATTNTYRS
jgi:hypothetical protein